MLGTQILEMGKVIEGKFDRFSYPLVNDIPTPG